MFSWSKPTDLELRTLTKWLQSQQLTYSSSDGSIPVGFAEDRLDASLGSGAKVFSAAKQAVVDWKMFPNTMAELWPAERNIVPGEIVHVLFRAGPLWTTNSCRILRLIDEDGDVSRFGFTYGTLPGHVARGEETFVVCWDRASDLVTYSLSVFSRPAHWLIWLGYPYARAQQAKFRRLSGQSMQLAVQEKMLGRNEEVSHVSQ